jgi:hypothetical protein
MKPSRRFSINQLLMNFHFVMIVISVVETLRKIRREQK